jgi:hypothetical protein
MLLTFPLLYELTNIKDSTVAQIIEYNRFYITFTRLLNAILTHQLHSLYTLISSVTLKFEQ